MYNLINIYRANIERGACKKRSPQRLHLAGPWLLSVVTILHHSITVSWSHRLLGLLQAAAAGSIGVDCPGWRLWSSHSTPTQTHPRTRMPFIDFRTNEEHERAPFYMDNLLFSYSFLYYQRIMGATNATNSTSRSTPFKTTGGAAACLPLCRWGN